MSKTTKTTGTKKATGRRISPKKLPVTHIAGLPIEGLPPELAIIADESQIPEGYEGEDLGDYIEGATYQEQLAADKKTFAKIKASKPKVVTPREYQGAPMAATRVYTRQMTEFKTTRADTWLLVNDEAGTFSTANTYKGGLLAPSHRPEKYTWTLDAKATKKVAAKIETMTEVEPADWPTWITRAATRTTEKAPAKKTRKAK